MNDRRFLCESSCGLLHLPNDARVLILIETLQPKVWLLVLRVELDNFRCNVFLVCPCTRIPDTSTEITRPPGV